jgi:hypothetical protein
MRFPSCFFDPRVNRMQTQQNWQIKRTQTSQQPNTHERVQSAVQSAGW